MLSILWIVYVYYCLANQIVLAWVFQVHTTPMIPCSIHPWATNLTWYLHSAFVVFKCLCVVLFHVFQPFAFNEHLWIKPSQLSFMHVSQFARRNFLSYLMFKWIHFSLSMTCTIVSFSIVTTSKIGSNVFFHFRLMLVLALDELGELPTFTCEHLIGWGCWAVDVDKSTYASKFIGSVFWIYSSVSSSGSRRLSLRSIVGSSSCKL